MDTSIFQDLNVKIVKHRRALHVIPETGINLPKTRQYIVNTLEQIGVPYYLNAYDSGIIAKISIENSVKTIAFRSDMDALPIQEATGLSFASMENMHACGHDAHMAILLTTIEYLWSIKDSLRNSCVFLFQTAEETAEGARNMVNEYNYQQLSIDEIYGLHVGCINPEIANGSIGIISGPIMASFDRFVIKVHGKGCHGSTPENSIDPILTSTSIINELNIIKSREVSAITPVSFSIGSIHGGSAYNIIPESCCFEGTFRAFSEEDRHFVGKRIQEIAQYVAKAHNATVDVNIIWGGAPVINNEVICQKALDIANNIFDENTIITKASPVMVGEDFSEYLKKIPGVFFLLGTYLPEHYPHHNPKFNIDESMLWKGLALFISIAES